MRWRWPQRAHDRETGAPKRASFRDEVLKSQLITAAPMALTVAVLAAAGLLAQYAALVWEPENPLDELPADQLQTMLSDATPAQSKVLALWIAQFGLQMQPVAAVKPGDTHLVTLSDGRQIALSTAVSWLENGQRVDPTTGTPVGAIPGIWQAALPGPGQVRVVHNDPLEPPLAEMRHERWKTLLLPLTADRYVAISSPDFKLAKHSLLSIGAVVFAIAFVGTGMVVFLFFWGFRNRFAARSAARLSAPLERLSEAVRTARLTARFTTPVPVPPEAPRELAELFVDFNALQMIVSDALADRDAVIDSQRTLVADLAHELRTPLTVISGHAEVLSRTAASAASAEVIQRQAQDLHTLLSDLLDMARLDSIEGTLQIQPVDLVALANEMVERFSTPARRYGVSVCLERAPSNGHALTTADPRWLRQVLANLLTNAIRFTPEGGVVALSIYPHAGMTALQIEDSGPGMESTDARLAAPIDGRGAGLGLKVAKRLIEAMGGSMRLGKASLGGTAIELSFLTAEQRAPHGAQPPDPGRQHPG
ncbi:MAG: sensor histidine kinase [Acidovorax sp.]|jgi:signal transduction histidine kinase